MMSVKPFLKNTKIVSTFGPAITFDLNLSQPSTCSSELKEKVHGIIESVFNKGVNCVRYNFSHGFVDENTTRRLMINSVQLDFVKSQASSERRYLKPVVMMADTKGPEIRVFNMGSGVSYSRDKKILIRCIDQVVGSEEGFSVVDATGKYNMANDCVEGNLVLVEDGKLTLEILSVNREKGLVEVKVKNSYFIKTNKRINLPGADYSMDFLSDKDSKDIKYAIDNGFEYVALSFANSKKDIDSVRNLISSYCNEKNIPNIMKVYSKIETLKSCKNIDEIVEASDGIMIARGDLGLEIPYYEVPYWTKSIINKCRLAKKPVITATQMLDSLERNVVATRAEVSDVYRAAEMGSDCTMLSGETAQGQFPELAVETMANIVYESERHFNSDKFRKLFESEIFDGLDSGTKSRVKDLVSALDKNKNVDIIAMKWDDESAEFLKAISALRLSVPVFVFHSVNNVEEYCNDPKWGSKDYLSMKVISGLALHRGINFAFVDGNTENVSAVSLFREYFSVYVKDCCPECCAKYVLCFSESEKGWKLVE